MAKTNYDVPAVRKAIRLIELLCDVEQPLGISEISRRLDMNKNMVFRLLRTLTKTGWIMQEEKGPKFRIGLRPFHHTSKPVGRMSLQVAAAEPLRKLWETGGECTYLGVLDVDRVLYLETFDPTRGNVRISVKVGGRYLMHCAAPGKVLLAYGDDEVLQRLAREGFERCTRHTMYTLPKLRKHFREIVRQGYAVDIEESADGLMCFAVPVYDYQGTVVGSVGISVLTLNYSAEQMIAQLGPHVIEAGRKISVVMGYCD